MSYQTLFWTICTRKGGGWSTQNNHMKSWHNRFNNVVKGIVHSQKIFFKYVMLRTVTKNSTTIITKYTRYHRYREIIQISGGPPLRLHRKPNSNAGRRKLKCSDVTWALSRLTHYSLSWALISEPFWIILLLSGSCWLQLICLYIIHDIILTR